MMDAALVPFLREGIRTRINELCDEAGGKRALAEKSGVSEPQVHRYVKKDGSQPTAVPLAQLCEPFGVSLHWVVKGEGPKYVKDLGRKEVRDVKEAETVCAQEAPSDGFHKQLVADGDSLMEAIKIAERVFDQLDWYPPPIIYDMAKDMVYENKMSFDKVLGLMENLHRQEKIYKISFGP